MDEERIVAAFKGGVQDPMFLGFCIGVLSMGVAELAVSWWHDRPSTFAACRGCGRRGADVLTSEGETWHSTCWMQGEVAAVDEQLHQGS